MADRWHDGCPPPTYFKDGILGPISADTPYASRIDYALANLAGAAMVQDVNLRWDLAVDEHLDHVPIDIVLRDGLTDFSIDQPIPLEPIAVKGIIKPLAQQGDAIFAAIRDHPVHAGVLEACISAKDVNGAHLQWSRMAADYLITLEYMAHQSIAEDKFAEVTEGIITRKKCTKIAERGAVRATQ